MRLGINGAAPTDRQSCSRSRHAQNHRPPKPSTQPAQIILAHMQAKIPFFSRDCNALSPESLQPRYL